MVVYTYQVCLFNMLQLFATPAFIVFVLQMRNITKRVRLLNSTLVLVLERVGLLT